MNVIIVIVTVGRREVLRLLLQYLNSNFSREAFSKIIVVGTENEDFPQEYFKSTKDLFIFSPKGMTVQRNVGMQIAMDHGADVITFLDDDFLPHKDYFRQISELFSSMLEISMADGDVIADGRSSIGYTFQEGIKLLSGIDSSKHNQKKIMRISSAYGCNMSVRVSLIEDTKFDEKLPLYSWLEDLDFSLKMSKKGPIVRDYSLKGVHLSNKKGRSNEIRYGYSQVINPIHIFLNNDLDLLKCLKFIFLPFFANIWKFYIPEPWVDRRGRLKGNLIAFLHIIKGRIDPTYIFNL